MDVIIIARERMSYRCLVARCLMSSAATPAMNGNEVVLYKSKCAHHVAKHYIDKSVTVVAPHLFRTATDLLAQAHLFGGRAVFATAT